MYTQENGLNTSKPMQRSYRHELKALTRADHARLDDLFSALDITRRVDYARFIGVHLAVFEVLRPHLSPASLTRPQLLAGLACLQRDLATLGQRRLETRAWRSGRAGAAGRGLCGRRLKAGPEGFESALGRLGGPAGARRRRVFYAAVRGVPMAKGLSRALESAR